MRCFLSFSVWNFIIQRQIFLRIPLRRQILVLLVQIVRLKDFLHVLVVHRRRKLSVWRAHIHRLARVQPDLVVHVATAGCEGAWAQDAFDALRIIFESRVLNLREIIFVLSVIILLVRLPVRSAVNWVSVWVRLTSLMFVAWIIAISVSLIFYRWQMVWIFAKTFRFSNFRSHLKRLRRISSHSVVSAFCATQGRSLVIALKHHNQLAL